jgi:uncharacterized protein (DUF1501 family)
MEHYHFNILSRRSFLDRSMKTGIAVALSTLVDIPLVMKRALAEGTIGTGKKLLFIWLRGANDGLNSLIPMGDGAYAGARPTLQILQGPTSSDGASNTAWNDDSTDVTFRQTTGIDLGNNFAQLHPSLKFLVPVYNAGELALIHRVAYPRQSRSHFDSQNYWETGNPNNNLVKDGIFYRTMLEYLHDQGTAAKALTGVSVQGSLPLILRGSEAPMTNLTDPTRYDLLGIPNNPNAPAGNIKATNSLFAADAAVFPDKRNRAMLQLQYDNLRSTLSIFSQINFGDSGNTFQDDIITDNDTVWAAGTGRGNRGYYLFPATQEKNGGWRRTPGGATDANKYVVPTSLQGFFNNLKAAALVLNHTDAIITGTEYGGFDTHTNQGSVTGQHPNLNRGIGWAMYALRKYFQIYGKGGSQPSPGAQVRWDDVVVITLSEFGRTTIENADVGTDHAEASVMFVAGGGIRGYNRNAANGNLGVFGCGLTGPVPWLPGTGSNSSMFGIDNRYLKRCFDYRSVLGEIIRKHLGATDAQLGRIIPGYLDEANQHLRTGGTVMAPTYDRVNTVIRGEPGILL